MADWRLSLAKQPDGLLSETDFFLGNSNLKACMVSVPTSMDIKKAIHNLGGLLSNGICAFEIWWDGDLQELNVVLVSTADYFDKFKQSVLNAYPNADFEDIDELTPDWFDKTQEYQIFDAGYRHGHYITTFDQQKAHQLITQISNTIQLARHAWIQIIFKTHPLTNYLQRHMSGIARHYKTITKNDYVSQWDGLVTSEGPREHPEKFGEFAKNYKIIEKHSSLKTQSLQSILSIRGLVDSDEELGLDFSEIEALPIEQIQSYMEHLTKNTYRYDEFYSEKKLHHIKINSKKPNSKESTCLNKDCYQIHNNTFPK